jgi:hypothetical protein
MADKKISALTAATTPLDGTEVLPIVQSATTVKVANNDLRPKQIQSNATSGVLQVAGPAAASTRVMTVPDANFTAARIDAAQSFTGDQTLSTGNAIQGTANKGYNFTANTPTSTSGAAMTSQLLNWYEEGTWTPADGSGAGLTFTSVTGNYTRVGRTVTAICSFTYPTTADATNSVVQGLPFTIKSGSSTVTAILGFRSGAATAAWAFGLNGTKTFRAVNSAGAAITNAACSAGRFDMQITYFV